MKKFLSAFLAVLMVLSMVATSMVTVFAADGAEEVHSVLVSNGEDVNADQSKNGASQTGWRNHKAEISLMELAGQKAAGMTVAAGKPATDLRFHYRASNTVDITKFTFVEFDLYVSDVTAFGDGAYFDLEFTSIGAESDTDESQTSVQIAGLQNGWNHVKVELSKFSTNEKFDATKWNFVRFFTAAGAVFAKELVIAIDNFGFSDGTEAPAEKPAEPVTEIVVPAIDHEIFGWEITPEKWNAHFDIKTPDGTNACLLRSYDANQTLGQNGFNMFWMDNDGVKTFNATGADTFAMDIWVSDPAAFANTTIRLELGSGSIGSIMGGGTYVYYDVKLNDLVGGLKTGTSKADSWNAITVSLASMTSGGKDVDWSKFDWFRIFNIDNVNVGADGLKVAIDNVRMLKGDAEVVVMSECQPTLNGWEKNARPIVIDGVKAMGQTWTSNIGAGGYLTFRNQSLKLDISDMKYVEFDVYVSDINALKDIALMFELRSGTTAETNEWGINDFKAADKGWTTGWNHVKWTLADMSKTASGEFDATDVVWFRIANHTEIPVNGSLTIAMDNLRFTTDEAPECENCHVVHAIDLPKTGTTVPGWSWTPSFTNKAQGAASVLSVLEANKTYAPASSPKVIEAFVPGAAGAVDASEADSFVFEFYVSNAEVLKALNVELELSSNPAGGDKNEMRYVNGTLDSKIEGGMQNGWNTVVIPISALASGSGHLSGADVPIDWTKVSYFRMYFLGNIVTGDDGLVYGFDNLRFTKDGEVVATLTDCEPDMNGWNAATPLLAVGEGLVMGKTVTGKFDVCDVYFDYVAPEAFDITGMKYLEFDFYLSNANTLKSVNWTIELTSAGKSDHNEIGTTKSFNGFVQGWNHIQIELSTLGDTADKGACDLTAVNYFRMFTIDVVEGVGELTFALANVRITDGKAAALETPEMPEVETPDDPVEPPVEDEDGEYKIVFPVDNAEGEFKYLDPDYKANWNGSLRFADGAQFFQYKFDLEYFCGVESITFAGNIGGEYHIWASANGKNWVEIVKNTQKGPAKAMTLDLSVMAAAIAETATLYIRIGDAVTSDGNGGHLTSPEACLTITYDPSVEQVKPEPPAITTQHEKDVFEMNSAEENAHLVEMTGKWNGEKRYADANAHFTYKYTIKNVHQVVSVIWKAATNQELKLDISFDNKNWVNVFSTEENLAPVLREYDLTEFLVKDGTIENATFYLKISDTDPSDGWGGGIHKMNPVTLDVEYTPLTDEQKDALEATATEHSIPLWGANRTWGDVYETDNENQLAGSGCISINLKGVTGTHSPSKKFDDVDATGMDSLEFDIYLSDLAILDHLLTVGSGSLEICSGGACDQGEKNYDVKNLANLLKDNGAVVGWNHVSIPLSKMAGTDGAYGPFDISKINYIRLFWTDMTDCGQDWIMKLDNFRMTDAVAKAEADRVAFENQVLEENAGLIANIEALKNITEVNAENYSSVKDRVNSAKTAFEALSQDAQDVLVAKGYKRPITDAQKKLDAYKAIKDVLDANADLIAELEALAAYADAASITKDNYETVKAAVEAAQAKVDALDADTKAALADYIANIATAKAAVDAYVPPVEKKGCGGVLTVGAVATMVLAGAWVTIAARKKED